MRCVVLSLACVFCSLGSASDVRASGADHLNGCNPAPTVTNANNNGSGSLRNAISNVCASGTITFSQRFQINLASQIAINKAITIDGTSVSNGDAGADNALVQINGGADHRSFLVNANGNLTLKRLRVSNGTVDDEGGAVRNLGQLTVSECRFDGNSSGTNITLGGGAIYNDINAGLVVDGSTFDGNFSHRGAAIFNVGDAELYNSTFSGNITPDGAPEAGGPTILNRGTLLAVHITVANNGTAGATAGGLFAFNADTTLVNSIFADNLSNDCRLSGGTFASTALLAGTGNCTTQLSGDPQLQPLADNGGVTQTIAPGAGSVAMGAGDAAFCLLTDQRGLPRPQTGGCDLGAVDQNSIFADGFE